MENKEIQTLGFTIKTYGDRSVGIMPEKWEFKGLFHFDNEYLYKDFIKEIRILFEYQTAEPVEIRPIAYNDIHPIK